MEALVTILKEQVEQYTALLELAQEKQQILVDNDLNRLEQLTAKEQKLILTISKLENKRLQIISTLGDVLGTNAPNYTLKEVAEKAPGPFQNELTEIYVELNKIIEELSKVNEENSNLINQALKIVNFTLDTITQAEREVTYPEREPKSTKQISRIFDSKV